MSSKYDTISHTANSKRYRAAELALRDRVPLVMILDGAGFRADGKAYGKSPTDMLSQSKCSGYVPLITAVCGSSAGHGALVAPVAAPFLGHAGLALGLSLGDILRADHFAGRLLAAADVMRIGRPRDGRGHAREASPKAQVSHRRPAQISKMFAVQEADALEDLATD